MLTIDEINEDLKLNIKSGHVMIKVETRDELLKIIKELNERSGVNHG